MKTLYLIYSGNKYTQSHLTMFCAPVSELCAVSTVNSPAHCTPRAAGLWASSSTFSKPRLFIRLS